MQWGLVQKLTEDKIQTITLPFSVTTPMLAIANITRSSQYPTGLINVYCSNLNSKNFKIILDYYATAEETANAYWLFIGKVQQWGSPYVAGKNEFLLAFSEFVVMAASSEYSYTADNMVQFAYLNYFQCNAGTLNSHRGWIALGI